MNSISKKKPFFPISKKLRRYLLEYNRETELPVTYEDLLRSTGDFPLLDKAGNDTLWTTMIYEPNEYEEIKAGLCKIYSLLKADGDLSVMKHLYVDRVDYCTFGNSNPFRVRIVNQFNDNYDYYYVKRTDASRIYGLELEHILSPDALNYLVDGTTLIEEHIAGIPGDQYLTYHLHQPHVNKVRVAKEFVKFNERCFIRLLGDMRSYNYVFDVTPDFDNEQYRIRAIDFDQQCYEGKKTLYLPQFFKENNPLVELCLEVIDQKTADQYQYEERTLIARRLDSTRHRMKDLIDCLRLVQVSTDAKVKQLREELAAHHDDNNFLNYRRMGDILRYHLKVTLGQSMRQSRQKVGKKFAKVY